MEDDQAGTVQIIAQCLDGCTEKQMYGWKDRWTERGTNGHTDGKRDGQTDGVERQMNR